MGMKVCGTVIGGNKIGRMLGFPTANIAVDETFAARDGVYVARVTVEGVLYDGMAYVGYKPSVSNAHRRVLEVNLFGFSGDLYDREIGVELLDFVREDCRMDSIEALRSRLQEDRRVITEILKQK